MEENDLSNNKNHSNPESHPKVEISNQTKEIPSQASSFETKDDIKGSSMNFRNPNETPQIHIENNQKLQFNSVPNPPNLICPTYTNIDKNIVKKNQQRNRNRNINPNGGPIFTQQAMLSNNMNPSINLINNLNNPNMGMMPAINLNGNTNSNPNSPYFAPSNLITNNVNLNQNSSQSTPIGPVSVPKKEKNKEKKDKNIKKVIKEKKEKTKTKKFHQINKNKIDSDSDNDYVDWSRSSTRHSNSTGSERSVRRNTDLLHQQNSGNPLDVWVMSLPFFKPLPTESEIEKYCGNIEKEKVDQRSENNSINNESLPQYKHWSSSMKDVVINTINSSASHSNYSLKTQKSAQQTDTDQNLSKNNSNQKSTYKDYFFNSYRLKNKESTKPSSQNNSGILFPPEPFPELTDISSFWLQNAQEFPVTDLQMQNYSIMDNILSAFVVAEPDKTHDKFLQEAIIKYHSPFSLKNEEINNDEENEKNSSNEDETENDCFLPTHVPAPQLEYDDYLSHPFEEKLEMELQSIGFKRPGHLIHLNNSLAQDIEKYRNELEKIQPTINIYKQEILANLGTYKKDEERRRIEMQKYNDLLPKKHKK